MSDSTIFSVEGFYEDFTEQDTAKYLGKRIVAWPLRALGSVGMIDSEIIEPIVLTRNLKEITYKASKSKPLKVRSILYPLGGRIILRGSLCAILRSPDEEQYRVVPAQGIYCGMNDQGRALLRATEPEWNNREWTEETWRLKLLQEKPQ